MSQIPLDPGAEAPDETPDEQAWQVVSDLACKRVAIVNVCFYGQPGAGDRGWVLIDAGIPGSAGQIARAAEQRFGQGAAPAAIILTHAHIDHVGALEELAGHWDVPIFAHQLELQYLNGSTAYPPPDTDAGGGIMSGLARFFPRGPLDIRGVHPLPSDGSVPEMAGWEWIHVPGHTIGQVALWRTADRLLLSADAFVTTRQESAYSVATQKPEMHGPPMYFTSDWDQARESVARLSALEPEIVVSGHGRPMEGPKMRESLRALVDNFDEVARPRHD